MDYKVEVHTATHEELKRGGVGSAHVSFIRLDAVSDSEAVLVATQIAACNSRGAMPIYALLLDFPVEE